MADLTRPLADTDDDSIARRRRAGVLPPLLTALAGALGDLGHPRPPAARPLGLHGPHRRPVARADGRGQGAGVEAIQRVRDEPPAAGATLPLDELRRLLTFVTGGGASDDYLELLRDELGFGEDLAHAHLATEELAPIARSASP